MKSVTFINNLFVFLILSVIHTLISIKLPLSIFHTDGWLFRPRRWEENGTVYQRVLKIKMWKDRLPELSDYFAFLFQKKHIARYSPEYLLRFALETCRAELAHWCIILNSLIFTLWNRVGMSILMIVIAVALNLPYILIQRYNRPRILSALALKKRMQEP